MGKMWQEDSLGSPLRFLMKSSSFILRSAFTLGLYMSVLRRIMAKARMKMVSGFRNWRTRAGLHTQYRWLQAEGIRVKSDTNHLCLPTNLPVWCHQTSTPRNISKSIKSVLFLQSFSMNINNHNFLATLAELFFWWGGCLHILPHVIFHNPAR